MKLSAASITSAFLIFTILPSFGEGHHEVDEDLDRRTNAEIAVFLEEHCPEALDDINDASEAEDEEFEHELWQTAREVVGEFYILLEDIGREAAEAFISIHRNELIADRIVGELHDGEEEEEEALRLELEEAIANHLEGILDLERMKLERELTEIEERARELEEREQELEALDQNREEAIREQMEELLREEHEEHEEH
ncbi:MAG TPA: hypothetical protein DCQ96_05950, partial [Verrucomicrobiales bacterium]|nr:hypothetical protein [Verrucomicrobiales bacterium]